MPQKPLSALWAHFWDFWRCTIDPLQVKEFQRRNTEYIRWLCLWISAAGVFFHTAACVVWVSWYSLTGSDAAIQGSFLLPTFFIFCCMTLSRWIPGVTDNHLVVLICCVSILFVGWCLWVTNYCVQSGFEYDIVHLLPNVWPQVGQSPSLRAELEKYIRIQNTRKSTWSMLLLLVLEFSFLPLIGFTKSVAIVYISIPVGCFITSAVSDNIVGPIEDLCLISLIEALFPIIINRCISRLRQKDFQLAVDLREAKVSELLAHQAAQEAEQAKEATEAARAADSMLHHVLKNSMVDARGCIDLFLQGQGQDSGLLAKAVDCLTHGMKWCQSRQALTSIVQGRYSPQLAPVDLVEFGSTLVQGRQIRTHFSPGTAMLDPTLCSIMLLNAISNAFKHGHQEDPDVQFQMTLLPGSIIQTQELLIEVSNRADPSKPVICDELLDRLLVSREVSGGAFDENRRQLHEHVGVEHIFLTAEAHKMQASLSQDGGLVIFRARMTVLDFDPCAENQAPLSCRLPPQTPCGLRYYCLDDSPIARKVLMHNLTAYASPAKVCTLGATPTEVQRFAALAQFDSDIVVLDQYLEYDGDMYYGTSVAEELVQQGYKGLICIRSANASPDDEEVYRQHGAHCVIGKEVRAQQMVRQLHAAYIEHNHNPRTFTLSSLPHCHTGSDLHTSPMSTPRSHHHPLASVSARSRPPSSLYKVISRNDCLSDGDERNEGPLLPGSVQASTRQTDSRRLRRCPTTGSCV